MNKPKYKYLTEHITVFTWTRAYADDMKIMEPKRILFLATLEDEGMKWVYWLDKYGKDYFPLCSN